MLNNLPIMMAKCLLLTILIEGVSAFIIGLRNKADFLITVLVNCMTNPVLVVTTFLLGFFYGNDVRMPIEIVGEIAVVIAEGFVYSKTLKYKKKNPFLISLILNGTSYILGIILSIILY